MTNTAPIGVLTAIPEEIAAFGAHFRETSRETVAGSAFLRGTIDGRAAVLAESGVGKVNGAMAASILLDRFACRGLIFSGVAGGLDPALSVGDLVIATHVVQHDYGSLLNGQMEVFRAGRLPFPPHRGDVAVPADARLIERLRAALAALGNLHFGPILTGDIYLGCGETRERLFSLFAGKAIDMESAAVAQVADAFGVPWLIIRALSDLAGEDSHLDFQTFVHESARKAAAAVLMSIPQFD